MRKVVTDVFNERCQEIMVVKDMENAVTPEPGPFFPVISTNLTGSSHRQTLKLYAEQSAVARDKAKDDSGVRVPKTSFIAPINPSTVKSHKYHLINFNHPEM